MSITVRPVETGREWRTFLNFPWRLYRDDPLWVPPLMGQRKDRLDPAKNPVIAGGAVQASLAWQGSEPVGTLVTAVDAHRNAQSGQDYAMFGYFDCVDDYTVAEALFDTAVDWTRQQGKSRLWGPWMLDYEDSRGFLVKGWDRAPVVMLGHNPACYGEFADRYGFQKAMPDSLAFAYDVPDGTNPLPDKLLRVVEKLRQRTGVVVRQADFSRWDEELKLAVDVLNKGLAVLPQERGFWDLDRLAAHAEALKPVLDPAFVLIAEVEGEAVGWVMGLPDLNEAIKAAGGVRYVWQWPMLVLAMKRRPTAISMKSIAVDPEYWNRGVDALLVHEFAQNAIKQGYRWGDLSQTGEDNPMTPRLATRLGAVEYKRYRVYEISV